LETDAPAAIEVLGQRGETFHVAGHHYGLLLVENLEPGAVIPYSLLLDGQPAWPVPDGRPAPAIHTREGERQARLIFGSCRVGVPERPPYTLSPAEHRQGLGVDALAAYSRALQAGLTPWPDVVLLLGDQVYADEAPPETAAFIKTRRGPDEPPGAQIADFEEYTRLYRESWSDPDIRWLLSTVPSAMIFDDHDVDDDWNISRAWLEKMRALPWWEERVIGAFMSYWLYQHLGNLSPPELAEETLFHDLCADADGATRLREHALRWDRESAASRWAYYRDFGRSRLLVIDSRAARVLTEGRREMIDDEEWGWIGEHARGSFDHLILATSLPVFLPHGIQALEAWNEAICDGCWGGAAARLGEQLREAVDLEHWAAFQRSFERLVALIRDIARQDVPPATITILSGDVHSTYIARIELGLDSGSSRVAQVVCSPFRNPLTPGRRRVIRLIGSRGFASIFSWLARRAGVAAASADWRFSARPTYDNSIGALELDEALATVTLYRSGLPEVDGSSLHAIERQSL
jgi:PhoD-like phosphatase